jgi:hypothetical protein
MNKKTILTLLYVTFAILISACAEKRMMVAPDTARGDQLQKEYMIGNWCTDRELTAQTNQDAGHSGLTNVAPLFWSFKDGGAWQVSSSGWLYENHGKWRIKERQTMVLERSNSKPVQYQAKFKDGSLYLEDEESKFLVLSGCE